MQIPRFNNSQEFADFVDQLSPQQIRDMKTAEWTHLFKNLNQMFRRNPSHLVGELAEKLSKPVKLATKSVNAALQFFEVPSQLFLSEITFMDKNNFINNNIERFCKLYNNYHPEKAYFNQVVQTARDCAKQLLETHPQIAKDILSAEQTHNMQNKIPMAKAIRNAIWQTCYKDAKVLKYGKPSIWIKNIRVLGQYNDYHAILLRPTHTANPVGTISHEVFHSLQGSFPLFKMLKKLNIPFHPLSAEMQDLYIQNHPFYIESSALKSFQTAPSKHQKFNTYARQPVEYFARLFAASFSREVRHQIGIKKFNHYGERIIKKIMSAFQTTPSDFELHKAFLTITFDNPQPFAIIKIKEINQRFLGGQERHEKGKFSLIFLYSPELIRRLHESDKKIAEIFNKNSGNYDAIFKEALPLSDKFIQEKKALINTSLAQPPFRKKEDVSSLAYLSLFHSKNQR